MSDWMRGLLVREGLEASLALIAILAIASLVGFRRTSRLRSSPALKGGGERRNGELHADDATSNEADPDGTWREGLKDVAMMLELIAAMLDSGAGIGRALELIAVHSAPSVQVSLRPVVAALAIGTDWDTAWRSSSSMPRDVLKLKDALGFAALTGAPSAAILYAQAARTRREQFREAEQRAAALGVKLVVPLGLCSLPAFICLGVLPVLLAMLPSG